MVTSTWKLSSHFFETRRMIRTKEKQNTSNQKMRPFITSYLRSPWFISYDLSDPSMIWAPLLNYLYRSGFFLVLFATADIWVGECQNCTIFIPRFNPSLLITELSVAHIKSSNPPKPEQLNTLIPKPKPLNHNHKRLLHVAKVIWLWELHPLRYLYT